MTTINRNKLSQDRFKIIGESLKTEDLSTAQDRATSEGILVRIQDFFSKYLLGGKFHRELKIKENNIKILVHKLHQATKDFKGISTPEALHRFMSNTSIMLDSVKGLNLLPDKSQLKLTCEDGIISLGLYGEQGKKYPPIELMQLKDHQGLSPHVSKNLQSNPPKWLSDPSSTLTVLSGENKASVITRLYKWAGAQTSDNTRSEYMLMLDSSSSINCWYLEKTSDGTPNPEHALAAIEELKKPSATGDSLLSAEEIEQFRKTGGIAADKLITIGSRIELAHLKAYYNSIAKHPTS
ncbi:hypothetical protein FNU76_15200 [Chitinimonas arctica]|uniref:Uncharacterized protein n=1 Tax=Chitinimonas arctica TaxID=2594795 RepID=A0A516SHH6_9NEIS|nr:hypothetical protein [Chitinimonas arctica]QDQ27592.1 hypothetical protein FNU76_15200 [Chitinimonas arctica]